MTVEAKEKLYTIEEFLNLDLPDDADYELIQGRIVAKPKGSTSAEHGRIVGKLSQKLNNFIDANPLGTVYTEASCLLDLPEASSYMKPDVCFVTSGRTPPRFRGPLPVVPDLVIEVNSPSDSNELMQDKIEAYQKAGVRLIWSIYMVQKFVAVYRLNEQPGRTLLDLEDRLDGENLLPGFTLSVSEIFA